MATTGTTSSGIKYPVAANAVDLSTDLMNMMQSVEDKTVIRGTGSYVNDVGGAWLAKATGTSGVGLKLTNTTPASIDDRTWGVYTRSDGAFVATTYNGADANTGSKLIINRDGRVTIGADPANALDAATKQYADSVVPSTWTSYAPTLTGWTTNATAGTGATISGEYARVGAIVFCKGSVTLGTSPTLSTTTLKVSTPTTIASWSQYTPLGTPNFYCGAPANYLGFLRVESSTTVCIGTIGTSGVHGNLSTTAPATWSAGHHVSWTFAYRT